MDGRLALRGIHPRTASSAPLTVRSTVLLRVLLFAVALLLVLSVALPPPAGAQEDNVENPNENATTPGECVEPETPGDSISDAMDYVEAQRAYEDCIERTGANAPEDSPEAECERPADDSVGEQQRYEECLEESGALEKGEDPNETATTPANCVKPGPPGDGQGEAQEFMDEQAAYEDCLERTGESASGGASESECERPADGSVSEQREYEECLEQAGALDDGTEREEGNPGGLGGMVLGFFTTILRWVWDHTFGWMLENMASAFQTNLLPLPDLEAQGSVVAFYESSVEKMRPAILVGILLLGILMVLNTPNYDLAYAGFAGLPKLMGVAMAMAFLPQFMGQLGAISGGLSDAFFPSGGELDGAGYELFKASVGPTSVLNPLTIVVGIMLVWVGFAVILVALLKNIFYVLLFLAAPFALVASLFPGLASLAGSWFRGVVACAAIPALWSIEIGVGTFILRFPETIFGEYANALGFITDAQVTSLGAILIMWIMYRTPFKVLEWSFPGYSAAGGGIRGLVRAVATAAATTPVRQGVSNLMSRGAAGGAAKTVPAATWAGAGASGAGSKGARSDGMGRKIQQAQRQQKQTQATRNAVKSIHKYLKNGEVDRTPTRRSAPGGRRADVNPGLGRLGRTSERSSKKGE